MNAIPEMTAERWEAAKKIFEAAQDEPPGTQADFVRAACAGDSELESGVMGLLRSDEHVPASFLAVPAPARLGFSSGDPSAHSLAPDEIVLGRFRVIRFINQGGMGEVFEAWDQELQDKVALKTIRPEITSTGGIIDRFKQEVKQARGISHPNVCRVYDLYSYDRSPLQRIWFLTMQLLDGETLLERIRRQGPFDPKEALDLVEQMVAGLAAAHKLGVVHRDFKSSNVMLVDAGEGRTRAMITDFGLALNLSTKQQGSAESPGEGTPAYMAPEQRHGGEVGFAADQYALGVVMYEMLTGERPKLDNLATSGTKSRLTLPGKKHLPRRWEAVIRRCLEGAAASRFHEVSEIFTALSIHRRQRKIALQVGLVAVLTGVASGLVIMITGSTWTESRIEQLTQLTPATDLSASPSLSKDGTVLAYSSDRAGGGNMGVWVQHLPAGRPSPVTVGRFDDFDPSISPDGSKIVFHSSRNGGGIYMAGTEPGEETLVAAGGWEPRFSPDGQSIIYWTGDEDEATPSGRIFIQDIAGGPPLQVAVAFKDARSPVWSPDGRYILFQGCRTGNQPLSVCHEWWITSRDGLQLSNTGALGLLRKLSIIPRHGIAGWYGNAVMLSGTRGATTSIWELRISTDNLRANGTPSKLTAEEAGLTYPQAAIATDGTIALTQMSAATHVWSAPTPLMGKAVKLSRLTQDVGRDESPYISDNGHWLVVSRRTAGHSDIWIKDMVSGAEAPLVVTPEEKFSPLIDEAGETVVFESEDRGSASIWQQSRGQPQSRRTLCTNCTRPTGWFAGSQAVFYQKDLPSRIYMGNVSTGQETEILASQKFSLDDATWSTQNEFLLFTASAPGKNKQVFALHFPKSTAAASGEWVPITSATETSDHPRWSHDGRVIYYLSRQDGFPCLWAQAFDSERGKPIGLAFSVFHFHSLRQSPETIAYANFTITVSRDSILLNLAEVTASIWTGLLKRPLLSSY